MAAPQPIKPADSHASELSVLLVGNYLPDGQRSMQRFTQMLAKGLTDLGIDVRIFHPPVIVGRWGARPTGIGKWIGYIDKYLLTPFYLKAQGKRLGKSGIVHIIDHSNAPYVRWVQNMPHVVTCHDLLAVRSALGEFNQNRPGFTGCQQQKMIIRGLKRSQHIANVSGATKDDVKRLISEGHNRLHVIPNALEPLFTEVAEGRLGSIPPVADIIQLPKGAKYVFHIGGEKWYKNRLGVLKIFTQLALRDDSLQLVIVGPVFSESQLHAADASDLRSRIHYLNGISDQELVSLYQSAQLLLFPSLIEGFGWPIVEAQACGCPVVTLDRAPMNELNSIPGLRCDADPDSPDWAEQVANQCQPYCQLSNKEREHSSRQLREFAHAFSNEISAQAYKQLYTAILKSTAISA